jgi:hypothetical protein
MPDPYPWFTRPCLKAFGRLSSELGFSSPTVEQLAQERYVVFEKSGYFVSIVFEPGHLPLIELFCPTRALQNRRIPRLHVPDVATLGAFNAEFHRLCRAQRYEEADRLLQDRGPVLESDLEQYLVSLCNLLTEQERNFLLAAPPG